MLTGTKVAHPQFEALTGSWRLAAHVHILKKLGWPVKTESIGLKKVDKKMRERSCVLYYLPADLLELMKGFSNAEN